ncbi:MULTISPECIES: NUDIX hydrolase [unclassified Fusibacter]|uniref:NUDIX hydrolase n=1 Tax=unclassified Fusibacter TaxID=2624464 RepID=UPI0010103BAC|nr:MULTISPECIES: NUDIX hydrolase [unclassified Fusibacter]MCK8060025.1 NUDIX hydrolase [Fusibacter sp. A2]NPE22165.1 NUDIX hydrolase [Fusibacter sp. A1]RXV60942.1 NUDIX hydrolase [Fusibacter sp. A1]
MQSPIKIIGIKEKKELDYLHAYSISYLNKSGAQKEWELVSRQGIDRLEKEIFGHLAFTDGAMIFATDYDKTHVVLIREFRVSAGKYLYILPAGLIDPGESIEDASVREFKEETGLELNVHSVSRSRYVSIGIINERINVTYGYYSGSPSKAYQSDNEDADILFVDREKAKHILESEDVPIRTALLLEQFFKLNDFFR